MKERLISQINKLIEEYEYNSQIYADVSATASEYYDGKAEGLKDVLEMLNEME